MGYQVHDLYRGFTATLLFVSVKSIFWLFRFSIITLWKRNNINKYKAINETKNKVIQTFTSPFNFYHLSENLSLIISKIQTIFLKDYTKRTEYLFTTHNVYLQTVILIHNDQYWQKVMDMRNIRYEYGNRILYQIELKFSEKLLQYNLSYFMSIYLYQYKHFCCTTVTGCPEKQKISEICYSLKLYFNM